jgi:hypothetical protein
LFVCTWLRTTGVEAGVQKLLGHQRLNSAMVHAAVYDRTVEEDYYAAMDHIEMQLDLLPDADTGNAAADTNDGARLLELLDRLSEPQLDQELRLAVVEQLRRELHYVAAERRVSSNVEASVEDTVQTSPSLYSRL